MSFDARDNVVTFTPEAMQTLSAMSFRCAQVANEYGSKSDEYVEMLESFAYAVLNVLRIGGRVMRDDELALFSNGMMQMGTIFHPLYRRDNDEGKYERDPLLGTWSCHT